MRPRGTLSLLAFREGPTLLSIVSVGGMNTDSVVVVTELPPLLEEEESLLEELSSLGLQESNV